MTPGPSIIRECCLCGKHIAEHTIISGNTIGARFYTDGKRDAPMLPDQPLLVKCPHCGALIWIDEQQQVGEIDRWGLGSSQTGRFTDALLALTPTLKDYEDFLRAGINDKQKESYVRFRAWWAGNDVRRGSGQSTPLDSFETENLRALVILLDEAEDYGRIMKAEALRELGEFEKAEKLLATKFKDGLTKAVTIIRELNQRRIKTVKEMRFE